MTQDNRSGARAAPASVGQKRLGDIATKDGRCRAALRKCEGQASSAAAQVDRPLAAAPAAQRIDEQRCEAAAPLIHPPVTNLARLGGRLLEAGRDVAFLVRPRRAEQIARHGLRIDSLHTRLLLTGDASGPYDLVLLAVKAYSLSSALDDLAPAIGPTLPPCRSATACPTSTRRPSASARNASWAGWP